MEEQDSAKHQPFRTEPRAPVVSLVTLTDNTLATVVTSRNPEHTKREIAVIWVAGSMLSIAIQLTMVMLTTLRAHDLAEVSAFLNAIYPLMLKFNLTVVCPPVVYMVGSYFVKKEA